MGDYELYHAATRKHKYIKKIGNRYFYTQQEIQAYYDAKKTSPTYPAPKYAMIDGAATVKTIGKMEADLAKEKQARQLARKAVGNTVFAAGETKRAIAESKHNKSTSKLKEVKEAVAEATGRRDVYYEAKKVTENGRTYYDDDNAKLRTGKKDKKGRVDPEDGSVYTKKGTMQYDNEYTIERNKKIRARGKKKLKKMATQPVRNLKKQSARGKKALQKFYKNNVNPGVTVTYDEAKLK